MHLVQNAESAVWIPRLLHPFGKDVGSVIPEGFEAYARIFHPAYRRTAVGKMIPVRWRDIAAANGRSVATEMQATDIYKETSRFSLSGEELWGQQPSTGRLPREIAERLAAILPSHTQTPQSCWFGVWEGFGDLRNLRLGTAMFSVPNRNLYLLHGTVDDALKSLSRSEWIFLSPNLWWPDDRAWCVATEIDFFWSYVGGSAACIQAILDDPELEALPTTPDEGNFMHTPAEVRDKWEFHRRRMEAMPPASDSIVDLPPPPPQHLPSSVLIQVPSDSSTDPTREYTLRVVRVVVFALSVSLAVTFLGRKLNWPNLSPISFGVFAFVMSALQPVPVGSRTPPWWYRILIAALVGALGTGLFVLFRV